MTRTVEMATFVLIHGAGDVGWYWHLVERELVRRGHDVVVMDLPIEDEKATLSDHADVVLDAGTPVAEGLVALRAQLVADVPAITRVHLTPVPARG